MIRNDQHNLFARSDDLANGMNRELVHMAGLRGANIYAFELILGGDLALA